MKRKFIFLILCLLIYSTLNSQNNYITGLWKRVDDGSVYKFNKYSAEIEFVGSKLINGKFNTNDIKIKDLDYFDNKLYGFDRINNSNGELVRWEKVLINKNYNEIEIINQNKNRKIILTKIELEDFNKEKTKRKGITGLWKRDDGSLYSFEGNIAVLDRVGYNLEKGRFENNQIKIKNIVYSPQGYYLAKDRINDANGKLLKWIDVKITLNIENLIIEKKDDRTKKQYFTAYKSQEYLTSKEEKYFSYIPNKYKETKKNIDENKPNSDVDINIPIINKLNPNAFAVVIGNKNYKHTTKVEYAINDAKTVKEYLIKTLGFREGNIFYEENITKSDFEKYFGTKDNPNGLLSNHVKKNISDVFIFYSGHGAPGVNNKKSYLIPIECQQNYVELQGYPLYILYNNLSKINARNISILIDACFSGENIYSNVSAINFEIVDPVLKAENLVVITSSEGTQPSTWYNDKQHGMLTYFFLKGIQEAKKTDINNDGKITYKELFDFISDDNNGIPYYSRKLNNITQTPTIQGNINIKIIK